MNKVYNVIWSSALNALVVVAEGTKSRSKSTVRGLRVLIAFLLLAPASGMATTLPQGGIISIGEGTIVNSGTGQMTIKQNTDKLGINWQSFNVGADGQVIFDQPNKNSVALNRVIGSDASSIMGRIEANGQVFLINPNGVIFGKDSKVNVGGLVASTLDITDEDFKNGNYQFTAGSASGEIINNGTLQAAEGGYVAVLGKSVKNNGLIKAQLGTAALAAGEAVTLDFSGDGLINVQVDKSAVKALVDNQGMIQADGGSVLMTARATNALMDTVVNNAGLIQAQTINNKSGRIFLDGGPQDGTGVVLVGGTLDASAPVAGNGGFIETSGKNVQVSNGAKVTTASANGRFGNWVLDPDDFIVTAGNGAQTSSSIGANTLGNALALTNVELKTADSAATGGNIEVNADVTWSANTKLTLTAHKEVKVNANIKATGDNAGVEINGTGYSVAYGKKITLAGSDTSFAVNGENYTVLRSVADIQGVSDMSGRYVLANDFSMDELTTADGGKGFAPIGTSANPFTGSFDGLGHLLTDLNINRGAQDYVGLFGYTSGAQLRNLTLATTMVGGNYTGGLVGYAAGDTSVIDNITVLSSDITGNNHTGGVVGYADGALLSNLYTAIDLHGASYVGGIAGEIHDAAGSDNIHQFLINASTVQGSGDYVGGVVGLADGMNAHHLESTDATSTIGGNYVGGIAGALMSGSIKQSFTLNDVNGVDYVGGLVGLSNNSEISQSYTTSNSNSSNHVGGLVGRAENNTSINESFTTGSIKGASNVGGLVGSMDNSSLYSVYTDGTATSTGDASGGLVGSGVSSSITDSYSLATASQSIYGSGSGMTLTNAYYNTDWGYAPGSGTASTTDELQSGSAWTAGNTSWIQSSTAAGPYLGAFMTKVDTPINLTTTYDGKNVELPDNDSKSAVNWFTGGYNNGLRGTQPEFGVLGVYSGGVAIRNAGTYTLDATANARFAYLATGTVVVNKRDVTVEANGDQVKTYDSSTFAGLDLKFGEGLVYGDSLTIDDATGTYDSKNAGAHTISVDAYTLGGTDLNNYNIIIPATVNGSISKASLNLSAQANDKVYDGTDSASAVTNSSRFFGDDVVVSSSSVFSDKNAGSGKTVTTTWSVTGDDAGNYEWDASQTSTATISKFNLDNSIDFSNKTYDGNVNAYYSSSSQSFFAGDDAALSTLATFSDKNAGSNKAVTAHVTVTGADAGNYSWTSEFTGTASINKATLVVQAFGDDKVYDGSTAAGATVVAFNKALYDDLTFTGNATFADKNAGDGKAVSVTGINVTGADAGNYVWNTTAATTANISKAELTVTAAGQNKVYDSTQSASVNLADNRLGSDDLVVTSSSALFTDKNAGTNKQIDVTGINLTGADAGNYTWNTTAQTTADIGKADLVITVDADSKVYDGNKNATVTTHYNKLGSDDIFVDVWSATFDDKNAGAGKLVTAGLSLGGADADNYNSNGFASASASISKADLAITAAAQNKTYDSSVTADATLGDSRVAGDDLIVSMTGSEFSDKNAGLGKTVTVNGITVSGADAANYTWSNTATTTADISKASLVVSATASGKVYDASTAADSSLSDNRIVGDDLVVSKTSSTFDDKNAGTNKTVTVGVSLCGADAGNYEFNSTATTTADISKAQLTVTAGAASKDYDSTTGATVFLADDRISGDSLTLGQAHANFDDKNAGLSKTVTVDGITVTGADAGNYEWNDSATAVADIGKVVLGITATGVDKTYDGNKDAIVHLVDSRLGSDDITVTAGASTFTDKNADTDKQISVSGITVNGADANNYIWDTTAVATADINKAVLNVSAVAADKTYDGTTAVSTTISDNRIGSDDLVISGLSKFADKNAGAGKTVIVDDIQVTGQDAQNYTWNDTALTTATIGKAQLDITLGAASKDYDSTTHADAFLSDNRVAGDSLTLSHASANFEDKNAGTGKTVTVDGITVTGADAGNYVWATSGTTTADIGRAVLNITATGVNKTYDGTTDASSVFTDNRLGSDDLTVTADTIAFVDKSAANGKQISISGITVTGDDASNYIWDATAISTADITKAHLDISANAAGKTYDGTTAVSAALSDNRIAGDNLVITSSNAFADKNAGADKTVHIDSISVTGADALNYEWDLATTTTATIDKAQLQIDATASNKTYDGNTSASTILSDNRISGDDLLVSSTSSSFSDKNAGSNKTVTVGGISISGADADNYDWNALATAQADITKANLVITAAAQNKVYDGSSLSSTSLSDNRVGSDDLVITSTGSSFSDKNAADGKTVTVNGIGVTGADAANYNWSSTATTNANIAKANLSVAATASDKIYDGSSSASTVLADNRIGADDLIINKASSSFSDKNAAADKVVTVGGISVSGADAQNYTWNTVATTTADIAKAQLDITIGAASKDYDTTTNADVFLNDNRVSGDSLAFTHDQAFFDDKNAGSGKTVTVQDIGLSGADAGNYVWNTSATTTADIGRAVLAITATGVNKTYDGTTDASTTFSDNRLGSDDLSISADTVSFIDKNADTGKQISISGITVTGADASNYIWDATGLATADIAKATLNVTATAANKTYDGNTGVSTTIADNRIGADDLVISSNSAFADKNAGVGKTVNVNSISVTGADAGNYIWNTETATTADISKAQLVVTAGAASKDYDSTTHADAFLSDNRITGDNLQLNYGQASFADKNAGTAKAVSVEGITVTGLDAGNYEWNTRGDTTADIGRAVLTINATGVNKTYDGTTSANAIYTDNRLGSDSLTITADDATFIDKNAGAGKQISISGVKVSGADAANYIWDATSVTTADITKANLVVNATASDKIYNGSAVASTNLGDNRIGSDVINLSSSSSTFSDKNAGEDKVVTVSGISVSGADAQNYNWNTVATTTADIAKAQLDVTAGASSKDYDSTRNASVVLNDNRISGDNLSISSNQALFDTKDAGLGKNVAIGGISVTGADAGNYIWNTATTATADIGKAILSITAAGVSKTYDGTTEGSVVLSDNRLGSDSLIIGASDVQFIDKNADTGKQMSVSGITVSGADALNYIWDASTVATADINKAALNVNALASDKVYDGNTSVITTLTDNRILGDNLVITSSPSSFADKNAGAGKTVSVGGIDVSGTDALNYTWNTDTSTTANIAKANLVVDATGVNKTYDSTTAASATLSDNRISGDSLSLSYDSATFADKNAGTGKAISVNGINVTGADAGNYSWNTNDAASGNIDKASLVITASGVDKTYDGTKAGSVVLSDSRFANDDLLLSAATIAFADKNAGADKAISVGGINVTGADAQNYTWNASALTSADIAKAALTIGATAQDKVYDTTTSALIGLTDNRISGDVLSITGSGVFSDKNAGNGKAVNVSGITVTGADAGNYTWNTLAVAVADISKANLVISAVAADKTYDGTTTASSSLSDNRLAGDDLVLASTSTNFSDKNAGNGKAVTVSGISVTGSDAANYSWNNTASSTATINKAVLTVSGAAADKTYDGSVTATANLSDNRIGSDVLDVSAGSVKFSDKNAGLDKVVSIDGIAVAGADASNYIWNTTATSTADIAKATLSVIATAQDKVYDGASTATTTLTDNRVSGDNLVVNTTGSAFSDKNAGVGKLVTISGITLSGADAINYVTSNAATTTASINKAALSVVADAADKTYNGSTGTTATLSDNRVAGDVLSLGYGDASFADKNAGTNKSVSVSGISISGADAMNYTWNTTATDTASIAKANLAIVASGESKVYDGTTSANVNLADNRVAGDQLTLSATDAQFADKNAGFGKSVVVSGMTVSGADAGNYVWNTTATAQADISKRALQVSGVGVSKTYDGTTATSASLADDRILGDNLAVTSSGAAFADKNAGSGKTIFIEGVNVAGADANNYTWSSTATAAADISKAQLTVTATAADKVYNGNTAALSTYSDDRLAGDALTVNAASSTFSDKNAGTGKTVTVNGISLSGADAQNYTVNSVAVATANISKAALIVGANGVTKVYDGSADAQISLTDNRVAGDDLIVANAIAKYGDKNAGANKAVDVDGIKVTGADSANYTWNTSTTTQGNIEKANLTISGVVQDKIYDGSTQATLGALTDNRIAGDSLTISATGASFTDKNAGANKAATINGVTVTGSDADNYNWNSISITAAEITKAFLQLAAAGQNKVYDGTTKANVSVSDNRIFGDQVAVTVGSAQFDDKNAGTGKAITATGLSLTGADAGNYSISDTLTARADVAKADLAISADQITKVKGSQDPSLTWKLSDGDLFAGDTLTGSLERVAGEELGTYAVDQGMLSAGGNYNLAFTSGALTITDTPQQAPNGLDNVVSAINTGSVDMPTLKQGKIVDKSLGYNMLNLGIKLPETLLDGLASNSEEVEILK